MVQHIDINALESALFAFDNKISQFEKRAFNPGQAPPPPMTLQPPLGPPPGQPMDPNMAPPPGLPMDPNMAPPPGSTPPPGQPMDPNMVPPQGPPPGLPADPNMAPPPMDAGYEKKLTDLFGGVNKMAELVATLEKRIQEMSSRMELLEQTISNQLKALKRPAGYEEV